MTETHEHNPDKIFSLNNKIVCMECMPEEDLGKNECYHLCHKKGKENCKGCSQYHR